MRVKYFAFGINIRSGGGSNYSLHLTLTELHRRGVDIELFVLSAANLQAPESLLYPIHDLKWRHYGRLATMVRLQRLLKQHEFRSDIYHLYDPQLILGGGLYRSSGGNVPIVATLNDYQPFCSNTDLMDGECHKSCTIIHKILHRNHTFGRKVLSAPLEVYWDTRRRKYAQSIDRLLPDSDSLRTVYSEAGFDMTQSTVISEMIDYPYLRTLDGRRRRAEASDGRAWRIAYVGRLIRAKGVDLLLDAIAELRPHPRLHLHIAGDGPERAALERQVADLDLADHVTFHGWIPHDQIWTIYQAVDLFVHPGRWPEPFGRTVIEAMTLGLPTVVSDVGHPPVLVRGVGLTFRSGDSADLARTIATAIDDYDRRLAAAHASRGRIAQFSADVVVSSLMNVYQGLVQPGHAAEG